MGRSSKSEERKQEILQGCYDVINREGFEKATLKNIGRERGIAPSLVSHYFSKKDELVAELVDFTFEKERREIIPYIEEGKTSREKLQRYITKMVTLYLDQNVQDNVFYSCFYRSLYDEAIHDKFKKIYDYKENLPGQLVTSIKEELGDSSIDVEETVLLINTFIEGINFMHAIQGDDEYYKQATQKFIEFIEKLIFKDRA